MAFARGMDGPVPIDRRTDTVEFRRTTRSWRLGAGTLACPRCDAPVAPGDRPLAPAEPIGCPFCAHTGFVREFLSLSAPSRPARVVVRVRAAGASRSRTPR